MAPLSEKGGGMSKTDKKDRRHLYIELPRRSIGCRQIWPNSAALIARAEDAKRGLCLLDQVYELMYQVAEKQELLFPA